MKRPTIQDIAERAEVSRSAVSFALNDKPGVSPRTRDRILEIAAEMGWVPSAAARQLQGAGAGAVGLVISRPAQTLGVEPFFMQLIAGIESELGNADLALMLQVVDNHTAESRVHRTWWAERRIDGILVFDPHIDDIRVPMISELGIPASYIGIANNAATRADTTGVWSDDAAAMTHTLEYLAELGHRRVAYITGDEHLYHVKVRSQAFTEQARALGFEYADIVVTDYSPEEGASATRRLLSQQVAPTAIISGNDVMALAALGVAQEMSVTVPDQLSLVSWDDSTICSAAYPALTALRRDVLDFGAKGASLLIDLIRGAPPRQVQMPTPRLLVRASSALGPTLTAAK